MTSRLRGLSAVKDTPRTASFAKDHFDRSEPEVHSGRSCKNGGRGNRYHFGMSKQHDDNKVERNGRESGKETEEDNADLLYRKSKEHFASWDIKDIVDDTRKSKRQDLDDTRLTNGKFRNEPVSAKVDKSQQEYRDEGYVGSLPREDQQRSESVEREVNGPHRSRKKESWEEQAEPRSRGKTSKIDRNNANDALQPVDERDILLKEIENLAIDGSQSPDRRIQAMIERLKAREESKLRSRREQRSVSPEKEAYGRTRSGGRNDLVARSPVADHSFDNRSNDRNRKQKDDREEERRPSEFKLYGKSDRDEETASRRDRSTDRRSRSIERQDEDRKPRRDDSLRKRNDAYSVEKNYRRRSKEDEEDQLRSRDSSKRRSYTYEGSPEEFEVKIQKYDRALLEPRRDLDRNSPKRSSPREPNLIRRESLKDYDREPVTKKSSFRTESKRGSSKDRNEPGLTRKTSFKDQDDTYRKHVSKNQHETFVRYFGKDQEDSFRKDSNVMTDGKNSFRTRDSEFGRTFPKDQHDDVKKITSKETHAAGVSRIVLKNFDDESSNNNSFRNAKEDSGRKHSFKEKNVEFGGTSYKDRKNDSERRKNSLKNDDEEFGRTTYRDYENNIDRKIANDRYIEFGKVSFNTQVDGLRVSSPYKEENDEEIVKTNSFKERDAMFSKKPSASSRSRNRDAFDEKSDKHLRSLTPPKKDEPELSQEDNNAKNSKNFCAKSWYESNRLFSAKYLRDHSKLQNPAEARVDVDVSPEYGFSKEKDPDEDNLQLETRDRIDSGDGESQRFSTRERNGATIIKIRSEDPGAIVERRRRRRPAQELCVVRRRRYEDDDGDSDEDEDDDRRRRTRRDGGILPGRGGGNAGGATPSRTIWNYREGVWHFHESVAFDRSFMVQRREAIFINRWRR